AAAFGNAMSEAFYAKWPSQLVDSNAHDRTWLGYDPYANLATLPTTRSEWWASGMRMQYVKDAQSLFWSYTPYVMNVDHNVNAGQHFQLWRDGSWVVREPSGYDTGLDGVQACDRGKNSISLANLPGHMYDRSFVRRETGSDWVALTSQTQGSFYQPGYYNPPPSFVTSCERRIVYLKDGGFDIVVVRDVIDAVDPETLPNFTRYRASNPSHQAYIQAKDAVKVSKLHTETLPGIASNVATWTSDGTGNGGVVTTTTCHTLLPAGATLYTVDESTLWSGVPGIRASERKYQLRVRETSEQQVTTFLHVIISGNGTQPSISGASASGVTVGTRTVTFGASSTTVS